MNTLKSRILHHPRVIERCVIRHVDGRLGALALKRRIVGNETRVTYRSD